MKKALALMLGCVLTATAFIGAHATTPTASYVPGSYTASVKGFGGDVSITVTVDDSAITSVTATGDNETPGVGSKAVEQLPAKILEAQSAEVDAVSGCTVSSEALIAAAKLALSEAQGQTGGKVSFVPGEYTAVAQGHNGTVTVKTVFSENAIENIEVVKHFDTPGVHVKALIDDLPAKIIEQQSLAVDTIAGATVSSNALLSAVKKCVEQAQGNTALLMIPTEKPAPGAAEYTADVIVIGAGGAGLAAAQSANELGASVIVLEKEGYVGGNTMVSGGIFNCPDPELQSKVQMTEGVIAVVESALNEQPVSEEHARLIAAVQADYDAWKAAGSEGLFDSINWFALQTWNGGDKVADLSLVYTMSANAFDTMEWLKTLGWSHTEKVSQGAGALYQRTHQNSDLLGTGMIKAFTNAFASTSNLEIFYNTTAEDLIMDGGKCVGVTATDKDGNTYTFKANNGVVIATGGFGRNLEMINKYNTSGKWPDLSSITCTNMPGITGDGILMAESVGAALRDMDQIQLLMTTQPVTGNCVYAYVAPENVAGYLFLNAEGERFIGEDGRRDDISLAVLRQTDAIFYMLESGDVIKDPENTTDLIGVPLQECIDAGAILYGETLEELCENVGWKYETVKGVLDSYNANVDANAIKDEYGRSLFTIKLENGPWYAIPRTPSVHHTMGGIVIDTDARVMNTEGNAIAGLYAAGEVTGGIHGANRMGGNALVDCLTFGRIAGRSVVSDSNK